MCCSFLLRTISIGFFFFVAIAAGTRQLLLCHVGVKSSASIRGAGVRIILISGANEATIKMPRPTHVHTTARSDSSVPPSLVSLEIIFKVRHLPYRNPHLKDRNVGAFRFIPALAVICSLICRSYCRDLLSGDSKTLPAN
jgi:hypothetical protein